MVKGISQELRSIAEGREEGLKTYFRGPVRQLSEDLASPFPIPPLVVRDNADLMEDVIRISSMSLITMMRII